MFSSSLALISLPALPNTHTHTWIRARIHRRLHQRRPIDSDSLHTAKVLKCTLSVHMCVHVSGTVHTTHEVAKREKKCFGVFHSIFCAQLPLFGWRNSLFLHPSCVHMRMGMSESVCLPLILHSNVRLTV